MEITARRLAEALPGRDDRVGPDAGHQRAQDVRPAAAARSTARRSPTCAGAASCCCSTPTRPSHGPLTLLMHLMSAGRLMLYDKRGSLRDKTSRVLIRLPDDRELRLREFGTKQAAWVKLLTLGRRSRPSRR